jgi:hypothetical protein
MAQRRNSSGRGDASDLDDTKALAAKARSTTGGPIVAPNPAELSGVRPRRDSVIGARLTPPPRQTSGELPNWFFGALGFLIVLLVGFAGLVVLERSGKLDALLGGDAGPTVASAPPAAPPAPAAPAPEPAPAEPAPAAAPAAAAPTAAAPHAAPAPEEPPRPKAPAAEKAAEPAPAAVAEKAPEPAAPEAESPRGAKPSREHSAAPSKGHAVKPADPGTAEPGEGESEEPAAPAAKPARAAAAAKPAETEEPADDQSPPGQDAVEAALDALSTKVRGCFVKYQIKGTARVRLVATPGGTTESVHVTGDFEDMPTGLCVEEVISNAKLPTFKGPPLKLSQSYQLR